MFLNKSLLYRICICICLLLVAIPKQSPASSQDSTPVSVTQQQAHFSLRAHGDYSTNYFDDVIARPGETMSLEVAITNLDPTPLEVLVFSTNAWNPPNGGFSAAPKDETPVGSTLWVDFPTQEITLEGLEQVILPVAVSVPQDTEPGQYISALSAVTVDAIPLPGAESVGFKVQSNISLGILVPGGLSVTFSLGEPELVEQILVVPVANTGNYLVRPQGELTVADQSGAEVLTIPVQMGSVYAGNRSVVQATLPSQLPEGEYAVTVTLTDADSGANAVIETATPIRLVYDNGLPYKVVSSTVTPNGTEISYATVTVAIDNEGDPVAATDAVLKVYLDGSLVEDFPVGSNQMLIHGENVISGRYIPENGWNAGTYSFRIELKAVDSISGQKIELISEPLNGEIIIP